MLELNDLCFSINKDGNSVNLVDKVSITLPSNHFMAIVGPSGCGKTTLLRTIAGLNAESAGSIHWDGNNLDEVGDFEPQELGYVPQFSIAYEELTVDEAIESATKLRVKTHSSAELNQRIDNVLEVTGLTALADRFVKVLSGGQKRRLGLAMELVSDPRLLLCDEVTSGLDPRSEREIVRLLHGLSRSDDRVIISVTHSLAHLELYDSILVLHEGRVAYHGPPSQLTHYFSVDDTEEIYPRLSSQESSIWQSSWMKHRGIYYDQIAQASSERAQEAMSANTEQASVASLEDDLDDTGLIEESSSTESDQPRRKPKPKKNQEDTGEKKTLVELPGVFSQFSTLLARRFKIFSRDKGQIILQLAVLLIFPALVTIFAGQADKSPRKLTEVTDGNIQENLALIGDLTAHNGYLGSALAGIVMFQIVLLCLMGSNNSAREVAGERPIWEKEKFGGVSPLAYLGSKVCFMAFLIIIQSLVMAFSVNLAWPFPGESSSSLLTHALLLTMVNSAITFICLGVSSMMKTAEQASLLSIYIVGFQLPLSGAVLALPKWLEHFSQPFIAAYWSWSGSIRSMEDGQKQVIGRVISTDFNSIQMSFIVLSIHILIGIVITYIGMKKHRWEH